MGNPTAYHNLAFSRHAEQSVPDDGENVFLIKHEISITDKHGVCLSIMISYSVFSAPLSCITDGK